MEPRIRRRGGAAVTKALTETGWKRWALVLGVITALLTVGGKLLAAASLVLFLPLDARVAGVAQKTAVVSVGQLRAEIDAKLDRQANAHELQRLEIDAQLKALSGEVAAMRSTVERNNDRMDNLLEALAVNGQTARKAGRKP